VHSSVSFKPHLKRKSLWQLFYGKVWTESFEVILILKYYLYKCGCLGDKPSINDGLKYLKYCIKIEKTTINFLSSTQKEYIIHFTQYNIRCIYIQHVKTIILKKHLLMETKIFYSRCIPKTDGINSFVQETLSFKTFSSNFPIE
jgi:hypothetical protein